MLKIMLFLSLINTSAINQYASVDSIYSYQSNMEEKKVTFEFNCDYFSVYDFYVSIDLYTLKGEKIRQYKNSIEVIGKLTKNAIIDCENAGDFYVLINVSLNDNLIVKNAKINFYEQLDCNLDMENRRCQRIYKSEYRNKTSKDYNLDFVINKNVFNKFLADNFLDINEIVFYSNFDLEYANSYLLINEFIETYEFYYKEGYKFLVEITNDNGYRFKLLDALYVNLLDFKFSDNYFLNSKKTSLIHFPYFNEYKEYKCNLIIESFVFINIEFNVSTSDLLLGDCKDSKYCLVREIYD